MRQNTPRSRKPKFGWVLGGLVTAGLLTLSFAYVVWPTPWITWNAEDGDVHRIPRLGGREEEQIGDDWYPVLHPTYKRNKRYQKRTP